MLSGKWKEIRATEDIRDLPEQLRRWAEIAQGSFEQPNWDECSLLHSFGDKLARDLIAAANELEKERGPKWLQRLKRLKSRYLSG